MSTIEPGSREEMYLDAIAEGQTANIDPATREEALLYAIANGDKNPNIDPATRKEALLKVIAEQGGGSSVEVEALSVTENGEYDAGEGKAYNPVEVDVPNTYNAGDEGKVVKNGALVEQTARFSFIRENGTYDTTENNSVTVAVPTASPTANSVSGTLAAPLGSNPVIAAISAAAIRSACLAGFYALISVDMSALGGSISEMMVLQQTMNSNGEIILVFGGSGIASSSLSDAKCATYAVKFNASETSVVHAYLLSGGTITDISPYASALPTVVTYFSDGT